MAEIRPAVAADIEAVLGRRFDGPWFGLTAVENGRPVGVGGIAWHGGVAGAFLDCPRQFMPAPLRAHRLARAVLAAAIAAGEPVIYVEPDRQIATARRWLTALGFAPAHAAGEREVWSLPASKKPSSR